MAEREKNEVKELASLADLLVDGEAVQLDPTEDAWEFGAPPERNVYDFKVFLQKKAWTTGLTDPKDPKSVYIRANLDCVIQSSDEDLNGTSVYAWVDTRCNGRKAISTMAGLLVKMGFDTKIFNNPLTPKKLAELLEKAIKMERIVKGEADWKFSYQWKNQKGEEIWENLYNHWNEFPDDGKGGKKHNFSTTGKGGSAIEVKARCSVTKFYGKGDKIPTKEELQGPKDDKKVVGGGNAKLQPTGGEPSLTLEPTIVKASETKDHALSGATQQSIPSSDEMDMELMLA